VVRQNRLSPEFQVIEVGAEEVVVLFPTGMAPERECMSWHELANYPMLAPEAGSPERTGFDRMLADADVTPVIAAECGNPEASAELVRVGLGILLTSESRVAHLNQDGLAVCKLHPRRINPLVVAFRSGPLSPAADRFRRMLTPSAAETGSRDIAPMANCTVSRPGRTTKGSRDRH
jgi:DNA-binding transcriptional LysR family regulator